MIRFRFNLQTKIPDKKKSRSASIKSTKNKISPDSLLKQKINDQNTSIKKHKFSLCSNTSM
jgi:hypothetical protein